MVQEIRKKLDLSQPVTYQIKVPGHLDERWSDWVDNMTITVDTGDDDISITTLNCTVDQAALQGLLRQLYSLGIPLISVDCLEGK
jgi:hypothetical protein